MRFRFIQVVALLALLAGAFAGVARALDFDDEDPDPVRIEVGQVLNYKIGTHAGCLPHHVVITSGELPPGLKLTQVDDHTALVSGVPTQEGDWNVWLAVKDCENRSAESLFSFEISHRSYAITTASLPAAVAGSPYSFKLQAGDHPTRFAEWKVTSGSLPAGLTLNPNDGVISGTATAVGASTFTVTVTGNGDDGNLRTDSKQFTLNVTSSIAVKTSVGPAEVGVPVRASLSANGGQTPYKWSATGLPPGVTVAASGALAGVPTRAGAYSIAAHLVDAGGATSDATVTLVVRPHVAVASKSLPRAAARRAYRAKIAFRGGVGSFRWSVASGSLPRGLKLSASTGTITGKAAGAGTYRFTVRVRDSLGAAATKKLALTVR
jgi:putative Ig domain-containing protein